MLDPTSRATIVESVESLGSVPLHPQLIWEAERLSVLLPLYALRWCAIILGELLPERWRHRLENNADLGEWDQARATQISKARLLISRFQS